MSENTPVSKDEIDLGQVLKIIGKFFEKIFNFIKDIALFLFDLLMRLLLLIKENILKFLIVGAISFLVGFMFDYSKKPAFFSTMVVQPNFNSTNQLYSDIRYYDGLTSIKDSVSLSEVFGIKQEEGSSIEIFSIQPIRDENEMLQKYDYFISSLEDSTDVPEIGYQRFKLNVNPAEFSTHIITIESTDPLIFKKLQDSIVLGNTTNKYLKNNQKKELKNYIVQDSSLVQQERKIDSLRAIYSKVMLKNAEKVETSGTNIQLAASQIKTNEMELFKLENKINIARQQLNTDRALKDDMINVISGFQKRGKQIEIETLDRKAVKFLMYSMIALFLFLFIKNLNTYLTNYKSKINAQ